MRTFYLKFFVQYILNITSSSPNSSQIVPTSLLPTQLHVLSLSQPNQTEKAKANKTKKPNTTPLKWRRTITHTTAAAATTNSYYDNYKPKKPWSPFCVGQLLLGMKPDLGCGW